MSSEEPRTRPITGETTPGKREVIPEQEAYLRIERVQDCLAAEFSALFKAHALSQPLYNVMRIVRGASTEGIPSQKVSEHLVRRDPDVTRLIDRLQKAGYVSRHRSDLDRRVIRVRITPAGRRKLAELDPLVEELHRRQLGHMSRQRLELLSELLDEALESPKQET